MPEARQPITEPGAAALRGQSRHLLTGLHIVLGNPGALLRNRSSRMTKSAPLVESPILEGHQNSINTVHINISAVLTARCLWHSRLWRLS